MSTNEPTRPAATAAAVTASNTVNFTDANGNVRFTRGLYVGTTGNIVVVFADDSAITFSSVPAGAILPVQAKRVNWTSTTASNIVAMF